jgi:hypothetical protein
MGYNDAIGIEIGTGTLLGGESRLGHPRPPFVRRPPRQYIPPVKITQRDPITLALAVVGSGGRSAYPGIE